MKKLMLILSILLVLPMMAAKKAQQAKQPQPVKMKVLYKNAKTAIKNMAGQDAAKKALTDALATRKELTNKDKAKIYFTAAKLDQSNNDIQNMKAYLKQPTDSAALFATILTMYNDLALCDSVDNIPNAHGRVTTKYHSESQAMKKKHSANLLTGGKWYLKKKDYANAYIYLDTYMENNIDSTDTTWNKLGYWATLCAFNLKNYRGALKYSEQAIAYADSANKPVLQEYRVRCYQALKSDESEYRELQVGVTKYPRYDYFFVNLMDWYMRHQKFDDGLAMADSLLHANHEKPLFWYAKSLMCLGKKDYPSSIQYADSCLVRDPKFADAYYNKGISYCNMAVAIQETITNNIKETAEDATRRKKIQDLYQLARPCMETLRQMQPDKKDRWAQPLYRIYLYLNMGAQFDEIDKLLKAQ